GDAPGGYAEAEPAGLFIENGAGDELRKDLLVDAECGRLLARQALAKPLRQRGELAVVGETIFVQRNTGVARLQDGIAAEAAFDASGNTPSGEADHEDDEEQFGHPGSGGGSHCGEHVQSCSGSFSAAFRGSGPAI